MKTTMQQIPLMTLALLLVTAAAAQDPSPTASSPAVTVPVQATAPPPDMAAFARGAKAWADNCGRCHRMRDPKELSDDQWAVVLTHMRLRAGLDGADVRDIAAFLNGSN